MVSIWFVLLAVVIAFVIFLMGVGTGGTIQQYRYTELETRYKVLETTVKGLQGCIDAYQKRMDSEKSE